jgi:hypothetical protein
MYVRAGYWASIAAAMLLITSSALGQHVYRPYRIDNHNHVIRDGVGNIIRRGYASVIPGDSTYIVRHYGADPYGSYYYRNGSYYYVPNTAGHGHTYAPVPVEFGGFSHVDDLASRLETLANDFCVDLRYNYSHNPGFTDTYREAYQFLETARYIHAAEHQQDRQAIAERLNGADTLLHHVRNDVRGWTRHSHQTVGHAGIQSKLDSIEATLHHLMNDVGVGPNNDGLASRRLETLANQLCLDLHHNYAHNPGFAETYREAYQLLDVARNVRTAEQQRDRDVIALQLEEIDTLVHHVQDDVRGWTRYQRRQIGQRDAAWKLDRIAATLHVLRNNGGVNSTFNVQAPPPPAISNSQADDPTP